MSTSPAVEGSLLSDVLATRVRGLMAEQRVTQIALSRVLGVTHSAVSDRLRGVKAINVDELPVLASFLGTSIEYLLGLTNERPTLTGRERAASTLTEYEVVLAEVVDLTTFRAGRGPGPRRWSA